MAGQGPKKRAEENRQRLRLLQTAVLAALLTFLAARLLLFRSHTHLLHWLGLVATLVVEAAAYGAIAMAAQPVYDASGALIDGGADLNRGAVSHYHDAVYVAVLVQFVAAFTDRGWWLYLSAPLYAGWLLWSKVLRPAWAAASESPAKGAVDPDTLRRMERAEKRSHRRHMKRF